MRCIGSYQRHGHGFRASASSLLNELALNGDVIERQLAHKERNKVRAAYHRAEYLAERRDMQRQRRVMRLGAGNELQVP